MCDDTMNIDFSASIRRAIAADARQREAIAAGVARYHRDRLCHAASIELARCGSFDFLVSLAPSSLNQLR